MNEKIKVQIEAAEKRLAQLKAREAAAIRREQTKEKAKARSADARRKLLLGVAVEHAIAAGLIDQADVRVWADLALIRDSDREALGLTPLVRHSPP